MYRYVRETDVITGTLRLSTIISGIDATHVGISSIEWFDPITLGAYLTTEWGTGGSYDDLNGGNAWTNRVFASVVRMPNDTLFITGGGTSGTPTDRAEMFDNPSDF